MVAATTGVVTAGAAAAGAGAALFAAAEGTLTGGNVDGRLPPAHAAKASGKSKGSVRFITVSMPVLSAHAGA